MYPFFNIHGHNRDKILKADDYTTSQALKHTTT